MASMSTSDTLSAEEKARIERNRQRALLIRQTNQTKLTSRQLFALESRQQFDTVHTTHSDGGFLIEHDDHSGGQTAHSPIGNDANAVDGGFECDKCGQSFDTSFLYKHFAFRVCDYCKDMKDEHQLITRTEAKAEYLLKDCDLDSREPALRFIAKKNPHQFARGDMRLYLRLQVEERALEVWDSEEKLEEERERRAGKRQKRKLKEYDNKMKSLRMSVRSSLYTRKSESHVHEFGDEVYNESSDHYERVCHTCGHVNSYEKM